MRTAGIAIFAIRRPSNMLRSRYMPQKRLPSSQSKAADSQGPSLVQITSSLALQCCDCRRSAAASFCVSRTSVRFQSGRGGATGPLSRPALGSESFRLGWRASAAPASRPRWSPRAFLCGGAAASSSAAPESLVRPADAARARTRGAQRSSARKSSQRCAPLLRAARSAQPRRRASGTHL